MTMQSEQHDDQEPGQEPEQAPHEEAAAPRTPTAAASAQLLKDAEDRLLRTQAELENFRKRSRR